MVAVKPTFATCHVFQTLKKPPHPDQNDVAPTHHLVLSSWLSWSEPQSLGFRQVRPVALKKSQTRKYKLDWTGLV